MAGVLEGGGRGQDTGGSRGGTGDAAWDCSGRQVASPVAAALGTERVSLMLKTVPIRGYAGISLCKVLVTATCFGLIDRRIEPPGDTPDSRGQVRSDPQVAQFFVMFCGAGSSPPGVSTAVARALGKGSAALALAVMRLACSPARIDRP